MPRQFTVIIPTLQRSQLLHPLVVQCAAHPLVEEVIVINNAPEPLNWSSPKVRVVQQESNIGVNPAWNLGARLASGELLAILNDDIDIPDLLITTAARVLRLPNVGVVGVHESCYSRPGTWRNRPLFRPMYTRPFHFGTAMFMRRDRYIPIPDDLVIFYGDDWLFYRQKHRCLAITGISLDSEHSKTSGTPEFVSRGPEEKLHYEAHMEGWAAPKRWERTLVTRARQLTRRWRS